MDDAEEEPHSQLRDQFYTKPRRSRRRKGSDTINWRRSNWFAVDTVSPFLQLCVFWLISALVDDQILQATYLGRGGFELVVVPKQVKRDLDKTISESDSKSISSTESDVDEAVVDTDEQDSEQDGPIVDRLVSKWTTVQSDDCCHAQ